MAKICKEKTWFRPLFDDENGPPKKFKNEVKTATDLHLAESNVIQQHPTVPGKRNKIIYNQDNKNWMRSFDPVIVEDLAVHNKKIQEVEEWIQSKCNNNGNDILLLTGPVGCGKTVTVQMLAKKYNAKIAEWITPLDIDIPSEFGDYEYREKQSTKFIDFIISAANFTSLLDNNSSKLVLVEDFPNTFLRSSSEFTEVLHQYKQRAKSPIVFICSESHTDNKNTAINLFTPSMKDQFSIHHIIFNSVSATGLRLALKRVSEIISKKYNTIYNTPTIELIDCVVNSSAGDVRSAVLNLHFACLKGSNQNLETSIVSEKENKSKPTKKKKKTSSKFQSLGKDQTVSILHGVGRVLNPKVVDDESGNKRLSHAPSDTIEQFLSSPSSFVNFLEENYLPHFSCIAHADKAASSLSDADCMLAEWREKMCQEYGLYTAVAGLMLANKAPVSSWNPVRGPKNMKVQYPSIHELPLLEQNYLYKGNVLATDYQTYYKIIANKT